MMTHVSEKLKELPENMKNYVLNNPISMLFMFSLTIGTGWNYSYLINGKPSGDFGGNQPEVRGSLFVMVLLATLFLGSRLGNMSILPFKIGKFQIQKIMFGIHYFLIRVLTLTVLF